MNLEQKIEAILFFKGEPMSRKRLSEFLEVDQVEISEAIEKLKENLKNRGIVLQENENEITLGTAPIFSSFIEKLQKEELNKSLSKASLETLSIILYKNGVNRSHIDYIRGVNSSFILRNLSVRGLIEKSPDPEDSRRFIYKPTFELLSFLGITRVEELPDYATVKSAIFSVTENSADESKNESES